MITELKPILMTVVSGFRNTSSMVSIFQQFFSKIARNIAGKKNKRHCSDRPALVDSAGVQYWFQNGKLHRLDGPAIIYPDGTQFWYQNGQKHRTDGPAIIYPMGYQEWWQNGRRHRTDGPAIIYPDGTQCWCQNGQLHRTDGPAKIFPDGTQELWYYGVFIESTVVAKPKIKWQEVGF